MKALTLKHDCFCQHYLHEKKNYDRPSLEEKKLKKGDIVIYVESWSNFYGGYIRVSKNGFTYDLLSGDFQ